MHRLPSKEICTPFKGKTVRRVKRRGERKGGIRNGGAPLSASLMAKIWIHPSSM